MNIVVQIGRLTRDPDIRYSQGANPTCVARFSIAVDRRFKREGWPTADFHNCVAFEKTAEFIEKYFHKGSKIVVQGRLENDNYQGQDGKMIYAEQIIVENVEFGESKSAQNNNRDIPNNVTQIGDNSSNSDDFMNIPEGMEEEIPFS